MNPLVKLLRWAFDLEDPPGPANLPPLTPLAPDEKQTELALSNSPRRWPLRPYLPLKRYDPDGGLPQTGTLIEQGGPVVYLVHVYELAELPSTRFGEIEQVEYASLEAIFDDEWQVD